MAVRFKMGEGDWVCSSPKCGNVNFARRDKCNRCGTPKPVELGKVKLTGGHEIGKNAADKSGGLFSADDWQCKSCGNVNWARRSTCNICNAPKFGVEEVRTGLGGGFKENDFVEYTAREDSDGEYDEFGRKKRKFRLQVQENKQETTERQDGQQEEEGNSNDNDEDDEDEEDVSKYDLGDEEDEDEDEDEDLSKYQLDDEDEGSDGDTNKYDLTSDSPSSEKNSVGDSRKRADEDAVTSTAKRKKGD